MDEFCRKNGCCRFSRIGNPRKWKSKIFEFFLTARLRKRVKVKGSQKWKEFWWYIFQYARHVKRGKLANLYNCDSGKNLLSFKKIYSFQILRFVKSKLDFSSLYEYYASFSILIVWNLIWRMIACILNQIYFFF